MVDVARIVALGSNKPLLLNLLLLLFLVFERLHYLETWHCVVLSAVVVPRSGHSVSLVLLRVQGPAQKTLCVPFGLVLSSEVVATGSWCDVGLGICAFLKSAVFRERVVVVSLGELLRLVGIRARVRRIRSKALSLGLRKSSCRVFKLPVGWTISSWCRLVDLLVFHVVFASDVRVESRSG